MRPGSPLSPPFRFSLRLVSWRTQQRSHRTFFVGGSVAGLGLALVRRPYRCDWESDDTKNFGTLKDPEDRDHRWLLNQTFGPLGSHERSIMSLLADDVIRGESDKSPLPLEDYNEPNGKIGVWTYVANKQLEDRVSVSNLEIHGRKTTILNVFDGHGGWQVAEFCRKHLTRAIERIWSLTAAPTDYRLVLRRAYILLDNVLLNFLLGAYAIGFSRTVKVGACGVTVVITPDAIAVANAGDCEAVLSRTGKAKHLSVVHSANNPREQEKLKNRFPNESDIVVCKNESTDPPQSCYVKGRLQPTRSFGDFYLKNRKFVTDEENRRNFLRQPAGFPYITAEPDVSIFPRSNEDEFIVVGSDGIYDVLTPDQIVAIVRKTLDAEKTKKNDRVNLATIAAQRLGDAVLDTVCKEHQMSRDELESIACGHRRRLHDDLTICVVLLKDP